MFFSIFFYQSVSLRRSPARSQDPCRRPELEKSFSSGFAVTRVTPLRLRTAWPHVGAKRTSETFSSLSRGVLHGARHTFCDCTHHCSPCGSKKTVQSPDLRAVVGVQSLACHAMVVIIFPSSPPFSLLLSLLFLLVPSSFPSPPSCPPQLRGLKHGPARRDDPGELKGMSRMRVL